MTKRTAAPPRPADASNAVELYGPIDIRLIASLAAARSSWGPAQRRR